MAHPPAGLAADPRLLEKMARALAAEGALRRVGDALVDSARLDALKDEVRRRWPPGSRLDVAGFKEMTGLSRKFVIPLLEYLDRERVTRRTGADRFVLGWGRGGPGRNFPFDFPYDGLLAPLKEGAVGESAP